MPVTSVQFPANWEQDTVALLPDITWAKMKFGSDPLLKHLPVSYVDAAEVRWDQYANPYGLIPVRGLGSAPDSVKLPPLQEFTAQPGFYGLVTELGEALLTNSRQPNTINEPMNVGKQLGKALLDTSTMVVNRFRQMAGQLLGQGEFRNVNASGTVTHHYKLDGFQAFSPLNDAYTGPNWAADPVNARPISDLIYWQTSRLNKGTDADFGPESTILVNPEAVNDFWRTGEVRDRFVSKFGASYLRGDNAPAVSGGKDDATINNLLTGMGLPAFEVVKDGYYDTLEKAYGKDPDDFTFAVPAKTLVWIGKRPEGQPVGALKLTRHAGIGAYGEGQYPEVSVQNSDRVELAKGMYMRAHFRNRMPHGYEIEMGFNAAPVVYYVRALAGVSYS